MCICIALSTDTIVKTYFDDFRALMKIGNFPSLELLDLSGCVLVTAPGISDVVESCSILRSAESELYYCNNIDDADLPETSGGCRNLGCGSRFCCRGGQ